MKVFRSGNRDMLVETLKFCCFMLLSEIILGRAEKNRKTFKSASRILFLVVIIKDPFVVRICCLPIVGKRNGNMFRCSLTYFAK
jgi:hypothetical protein